MPRFSKGFTLIELIAIMVIASILATSVIGSYNNYNRWQDINEQVLDMVNTLRRARDYCMAANEKFYLTVAIGATDSYTLTYKDAKEALNLPGESSNVFTMPSYVDFTATGEAFTDLEFNILGEPSATKTITINTDERTINIVFPTGYIYAN
jgi:prepilin-type N-terminal cleavage/methylation domain-containing protein